MRKGFKLSKETRLKMSLARKGFKPSKETCKKIGDGNRGKTMSKEARKKISENSPRYWLGKKRDAKHCKRVSELHKGKHRSPETEFKKKDICIYDKVGGKNKYRRLHVWVEKKLGKPQKCENCGVDNLTDHAIHWANKSGEYKKEVEDWVRLCVKCHFYKDRIF